MEWKQLFKVQLKMAFAVIFRFVTSHFRSQKRVVLYQGLNNHTKFGGSKLNSHEITAFYGITL